MNSLVRATFGSRKNRKAAQKPPAKQIWSIGIYAGKSAVEFRPVENAVNPVLTRDSVTDAAASFVADPFMLRVEGCWYMFFEVMNKRSRKGEIGLATSEDALNWRYQQIVLAEPFHLSYPYVFEWDNSFYMIPESHKSKSVQLYRADDFPAAWSKIADVITGEEFVDASIFRRGDRWWLMADLASPPFYAGTLRLFSADDLIGPWHEHPESPVVGEDPHTARPGGRVVAFDDRLIRYTQDCSPIYGAKVWAFEITELTPVRYGERSLKGEPVLQAGDCLWNESGMHHIDAHKVENGRWLACVDGFHWE